QAHARRPAVRDDQSSSGRRLGDHRALYRDVRRLVPCLARGNGHSVSTSSEKYGARILELADRLAQWSEMQGGLTCTYFSPAHKAVAQELRAWMRSAGLAAEIDAVGNVVGRYASAEPSARTLIVGSHYDTVANAGRYDGRLGILTALVVAEHLARTRRQLP